jgi:vacuolar iron transporter family protein
MAAHIHTRSPFERYLKEIVYGGIDGIVTTFAVVAGFSGAHVPGSMTTIPFLSVLLFGFSNLFADATSMGLGNFLSVRAEQDMYAEEKREESKEMSNEPDYEIQETHNLLVRKGFSKEHATQLTKIFASNPAYWLDFMMKNELKITNPNDIKPVFTGIATVISFIFFGAIPLIPYIFMHQTNIHLFSYSLTFTASALLLLGIVRWRITRQHILSSLAETLLVGGLSGLVAYGVGTFFNV